MWLPGEVVPVVVTVSTVLAVPPGDSVTLFGFRAIVGLEPLLGDIDTLSIIVPENPPVLVK